MKILGKAPFFKRVMANGAKKASSSQVKSGVLKKAPSAVETEISLNINDAADAVPLLLSNGLDAAMKRLHTQD